jgi:hypothetical protein
MGQQHNYFRNDFGNNQGDAPVSELACMCAIAVAPLDISELSLPARRIVAEDDQDLMFKSSG